MWIIRPEGLYIPHGSDETKVNDSQLKKWFNFISHMVQMKLAIVTTEFGTYKALYPTWFRWNHEFGNRTSVYSVLYIPHGSDETYPLFSPIIDEHTFISHMVQMKPSPLPLPCGLIVVFISHMVQMKLEKNKKNSTNSKSANLYPTWFRWNQLLPQHHLFGHFYLYPTWFRWNLF